MTSETGAGRLCNLMNTRIAEARKMAGLTQAEFAEQVGVTQSAVSEWERGLSSPRDLLKTRIARVLGITNPIDLFPFPAEVDA